jgi:trehalose/maltose hydrolase-like predicted phosphorylase
VEQFAGYFKLEDIDPTVHLDPTLPLEGVFDEEYTASTQLVKQADVLMLFHLLDGRFDEASRRANLRYYGPRTIHGSSLSLAIHAIVAACLAEVPLAYRYFERAMAIDSMRNVGSLADGVHAAAQGGLWQAITHGFAGMRVEGDVLTFDPHLPAGWKRLAFRILWRGRRLRIVMQNEPRVTEITLEAGEPTEVRVGSGGMTHIEPLQRYSATRRNGRWSALKPVLEPASAVP